MQFFPFSRELPWIFPPHMVPWITQQLCPSLSREATHSPSSATFGPPCCLPHFLISQQFKISITHSPCSSRCFEPNITLGSKHRYPHLTQQHYKTKKTITHQKRKDMQLWLNNVILYIIIVPTTIWRNIFLLRVVYSYPLKPLYSFTASCFNYTVF